MIIKKEILARVKYGRRKPVYFNKHVLYYTVLYVQYVLKGLGSNLDQKVLLGACWDTPDRYFLSIYHSMT